MPSSHLFAAKFFIVSHGVLEQVLNSSKRDIVTIPFAAIRWVLHRFDEVPFKRRRLLFRFGNERGKGDAFPFGMESVFPVGRFLELWRNSILTLRSHLSESKIWISLIPSGRINGSVGANESSAGNGDERIFRSFFQRWFRRNGRRRKGGEGGIRGIREKKSLFISPLAPSCPHLRKQKPIRTPTRRTRNIKESARLLMQKCKGIQYDGVIIWKVQLSFDQAGEVVWVIKSERFAGAVRTSTSQPCLWSIYRRFPRLNARWSPMNMENPSAEVTPRYYRLPSSNCRSSFKRSRCDVALPKKFLRRTNHPRYNPQSQFSSLFIDLNMDQFPIQTELCIKLLFTFFFFTIQKRERRSIFHVMKSGMKNTNFSFSF